MKEQLKYVSEATLADLRESIKSNLSRYRGKGFKDFAGESSWDIGGLNVQYDCHLLSQLDLTQQQNVADIDLKNSRIVGEALTDLTPSLANEEKIWVRLSHVEAFEYSRSRWLSGVKDSDTLISSVARHLFAPSQTAIRDDHAISRLWWNYQIARTIMPDDMDRALKLILKTADIRLNFVERIWMSSRRRIAGAILRAMDSRPEITATEDHFRAFMKVINHHGGGIVFEALDDTETDLFVEECYNRLNYISKAA